MDILLVKTAEGVFIPAYESDRETAEKFRPGEIIRGTLTRPRNIRFHRKYFKMLNLLFENQERFNNFDDFRGYYQMRAGFYKTIQTPKTVLYWPLSISFAKMDDLEFEEVYNKVLDALLADIPLDRVDLEKQLVEFM